MDATEVIQAAKLISDADDLPMTPLFVDQVKASNEGLPLDLPLNHHRLQMDQGSSKRLLRLVSEELHFMQDLACNSNLPPPLDEDDPKIEEYHQLNDEVIELRSMADEICDKIEEKHVEHNKLKDKFKEVQELRKEKLKDSEEFLREIESQHLEQIPSMEDSQVIRAHLDEKNRLEKSLDKISYTNQLVEQFPMQAVISELVNLQSHVSDLKSSLSGFKEVSVDANSVVLKCTENSNKSIALLVTLFFQSSVFNSPLRDVTVNVPSLPIGELTKRAVKRDDVTFLLEELKACWMKHFSVMEEVQQLRQRYAIDWQHDEEQLVVLLGKSVHATCVLRIPKEYPHNASISLISVSTLPATQLLKPKHPNPTLTQWLEYLEEITSFVN